MEDFGISEWNKKPILKQKLFRFKRLKHRTAFFYTDCDRYMLTAELDDTCDISLQMTANDISLQSETIMVTKIY